MRLRPLRTAVKRQPKIPHSIGSWITPRVTQEMMKAVTA
jgi:hypothetical protein